MLGFTSKMKVLALLLVATIVSARDFSKIKPGWMRNPTLVKMHEAMHGDIKSGIVGGDEAVPHSHPHQVGLFIDDMYFCGGSLICKFISIYNSNYFNFNIIKICLLLYSPRVCPYCCTLL